ncbi:hypothetical protein JXA47_02235 [Candidatus Sumerlaeota bacterium]|nr:hypothetical protein [Candidatus Sumerlaeota bacterium]
MRSAVALLALCPLCLTTPADDPPFEIGNGAQLFVDDALIQSMTDLQWTLHEPELREVGMVFDAPWEGPQMGYATVLRDPGGEFRLCYRGGGDVTTREVACLALSDDGIHWRRPELGLIEFEGSTANNIFWTGEWEAYGESHNFSPFLDTNPHTASSERYRAVALRRGIDETGERRRMLGVLGSPDGIHWHRLAEEPVIRQGGFDSLNVAMWDPNIERYVCYSRVGRNGLRSIQRSTSPDFLAWDPPEPLEFDPPQMEHYYTNGITLWPRSPGLYLGFPMRFVPERTEIGVDHRIIDGTSDAVFITSRDGLHWDRTFRTALIRPGPDPDSWGSAHGNNTPATGLLETAPGEISIYWIENCLDVPQLRRGTFRTDGFVSLRAGAEPGEIITVPLVLTGSRLTVNLSTSAVGSLRVEIQGLDGSPLAGFALGDCPEIFGDEIERPVEWSGGGDISALNGTPVRLRFVLRDADLYSFTVRH